MGIDPATLAIISSVVSGVGAIAQGQAAKSSANYNAALAENNAKIASQNATWAAQSGEQKVAQRQSKTRAEAAAIATNQAASGIDIGSGSALDVKTSAAQLGELNAINIRSDAARQAYGFQTEQASDLAQASLDRAQGKNAENAGLIGGATSFLGGASEASLYGNVLSKNALGSVGSKGAGWVDWNDGGSTYYG